MNLYELSKAYIGVLDNLPEDVDQQAINDTLESIEGAITEKAHNIIAFTKSLEAQSEAIDNEIKRLQQRKKTLENRVSSFKSFLQGKMELMGMDKIKTDLFTISIQSNPPSVQVTDEKAIPSHFITVVTEYVIGKKCIADALKSGREVPGATLIQSKRLVIR